MRKTLSAILALCIFFSAFCACESINYPVQDTTSVTEIPLAPNTAVGTDATVAPETASVPETTSAPETTVLPETTEAPKPAPKPQNNIIMSDGVGQYTLVRARSDGTALAVSRDLNKQIKALCGFELTLTGDSAQYDKNAKEILIGKTNRPESDEVYEELSDLMYAVTQVGNKIVIAGKNEYTLECAIRYFLEECIQTSGSFGAGHISVPDKIEYFSPESEKVTLVLNGQPKYALVYTKEAPDPYTYSYYDYTFDEASVLLDLAAELKKATGATFASMMDYVFNDSTLASPEILIGRCDRKETDQAKEDLDYNEYAVRVIGSKVVVTGHGFLSTYEAMGKFVEILKTFSTTENGKTTVTLPANFYYKGVYSNGIGWYTDIPDYQGAKISSVSDLNDGGYMIELADTSRGEYAAYLAKLESNGYKKYTDNEISGNLFATYKGEKCVLRVSFVPVYSTVKIIVEPKDTPLFALAGDYNDPPVADAKMIQLKISNETSTNGMCYIFRLQNGKFIVVDCGSEKKSADIIYKALLDYNVRPGKPVIAAWIFTHYHGDHYGAFTSRFSSEYLDDVVLESCVYGFPADRYVMGNGTFGSVEMVSAYSNFVKTAKDAVHYIPHAGDVMNFGDLKFTFLYTQDEFLPRTFEFFNDSSLTFMLEVKGQKILITGDASENSVNTMREMYGSYLKCDILQVPHHGRFGGNKEFFDITDPSVALIPVESKRFDNQMTFVTELIYLLKMKNVKEYYVSGNGTVQFNLPYTFRR